MESQFSTFGFLFHRLLSFSMQRFFFVVAMVCLVGRLDIANAADSSPAAPVAGDHETYRKTIDPFLKSYCIDCHGPTKQKGKIRLDNLG